MEKRVFISVLFTLLMLLVLKLAESALAETELSNKQMHRLGVMEKRLFKGDFISEDSTYRLFRLERELLYKTYESEDAKSRMKRLEIASQKKALTGAALPIGFSPKFSQSRMRNDTVPNYESVGIVDGLIKLYYPDFYDKFKNRRNLFDKYDTSVRPDS